MKAIVKQIEDLSLHVVLNAVITIAVLLSVYMVAGNLGSLEAAGSRVQTVVGNNGAGGTSVSATWPGATTNGNLLTAIVGVLDGTTVAITPPAGGWTLAVRSDRSNKVGVAIYYIENASSQSGASTWSISPSNSATLTLAEYSGMATSSALDQTATDNGQTSPAGSGTTAVTIQSDEVAIVGISNKTSAGYSNWTNGFSEVSENSASAVFTAFAERILASTGTRSTQADSPTAWAGAIATFKAALPTFEQSIFRWFANNNSTDVGSPLAAQDTAYTLTSDGQEFRLRANIHVGSVQLGASGENFKLQFAAKSGTCDTSFTGESYSDVTGATAIAYKNNTTPADGDNLTDNANDPVHSGHSNVNQDYEEANNFTNSVAAIPGGQDGLWDFALYDNTAPDDTSYCFRIVKSDASQLDTYTIIPEITTVPANVAPTGTFNSATQKTDGSGDVDLSIEVDDFDDDDTKAKIEYETDSDGACDGPWSAATLSGPATADFDDSGGAPDVGAGAYQVGSTATTRIITSSGSNTVQFDWNSDTDLPAANGNQCLRLTVNDDTNDQVTPATQVVSVDNVDPSFSSTAVAPSSGTRKVGDTATVTITAGETGLSVGACTVNSVDVSGTFIDNADNTYTLTYTVAEGNSDWTAGNLPISCALNDSAGNSDTASAFDDSNTLAGDANTPVVIEVTPVPTPTNDDTPDYTFSTDEAGSIGYGGDCSSGTTSAVLGNNTVTFNALADGTHSNCTIAVTDSSGNVSSNLDVTSFTIDATDPDLSSWDLNMAAETLTLTFDEIVDASSLTVTGITVQDAATAGSTVTLTGSTTASGDATTIVIDLSATDLAAIEANNAVGTALADSYLTITTAVINDLLGNPVTAIADGSGMRANAYTGDVELEQSAFRIFNSLNSTDVGSPLVSQDTAATLAANGDLFRLRSLIHVDTSDLATSGQSFKLQYAVKSGTCDTAFTDETYADVTTLTPIHYMGLTIPNDGDNLTANASDPTHGADTVRNQTFEELNNFTNSTSAINASEDGMWDYSLMDVDGGNSNTYCFRIVKSDNSLLDTYSVIPEVTTTAAPDVTPPNLATWELNINTGVIRMNFDEPMLTTVTSDPTTITIQDAATAGTSYTLTGGTDNWFDNDTLDVTLSAADLNAIKINSGLATAIANSYFTIVGNVNIHDVAGNELGNITDGYGVNAAVYTADSTAPTLSNWNLDMDAGTLTMNFSEAVDASTLAVSGITVQDAATAVDSYTLTDSTTASGDGAAIIIDLSTTDLNALKLDQSLATAAGDSFLTITSSVIDDMATYGVTAIANGAGQAVNTYTADTTAPSLSNWDLDMAAETLSMIFGELVDASTLTVTGITVQSAATAGSSIALTNSTTISGDGTTIVVDLSAADLSSLESNNAIATSLGDSYLTITSAVINDLLGNPVTVIADGSGMRANAYTGDPEFTQSAYRVFNNTDTTDVGSALADQDTAATLPSTGIAFRLRQLIHIDISDRGISADSYKLQFSPKSGTCDTSFVGESFVDVTGLTDIAYYNNTTPADGAVLTGNVNDPVHSGHATVDQDYEEANNFTNSEALIPAGQDSMWDFALYDKGPSSVTSYCFRVVKSDNSLLDTYSVIPEVTTPAVPDLSASTKADNDADNYVTPGQLITYTITIVNSGGQTGTGIDIDDTIDSNTENLDTFTFNNCGSSYTNLSAGTTVNIDSLDAAVGIDCVVTYRVNVKIPINEGTTINNQVTISAADEGGNGATPSSSTLTVDASGDLSTSVMADDDIDNTVTPGQTVNYTVTIINTGDGDATGVDLTDTIDTNTENLSNFSFNNCGVSLINNSTSTTVNVVDLEVASGVNCIVSYDVVVKSPLDEGTTIDNQVTIGVPDEGGSGATPSSDTLTVDATPNLATSTKADNDADNSVTPAQTITYTTTIINTGDGTATGVNIDDTIDLNTENPGNFTFTNCGSSYTNLSAGSTVDINDLDAAVGTNCIVTYDVVVKTPLDESTVIANSVTIGAATEGGVGASPSSSNLTVDANPDLSTSTKVDDDLDNLVLQGDTITYTLTIINTGDGTATGVNIDDVVDTDLENLSVSSITNCGTPTDLSTTTALDINNATISVGTNCVVTYDVNVKTPLDAGTAITNGVTISAAIEGGAGASPSSDTLTVREAAGSNINKMKIKPAEIRVSNDICTENNTVAVTLSALNGRYYMIGNDKYFTDSRWQELMSPQTIDWQLLPGDGDMTFFVKFRSENGNESQVYTQNIIVDTINQCAGIPQGQPDCRVSCADTSYDLYIVNPDGTERHMDSEYAFIQGLGNGRQLVKFEDSQDGNDFNDVWIEVNDSNCSNLTFRVQQVMSARQHMIKVKISYLGVVREDILLWADSNTAVGSQRKVDVLNLPYLCQEPPAEPEPAEDPESDRGEPEVDNSMELEIADACDMDCNDIELDVYIINPDGSERHKNSSYVLQENISDGLYRVRFEDSGYDFDYNDLRILVNRQNCNRLAFTVEEVNASWHHQIRVAIYYKGKLFKDVELWADSHEADGLMSTINVKDDSAVCESAQPSDCSVDCQLTDYRLYIVNPDQTRRYMGTSFVEDFIITGGVTQYRFEDSGSDFDYNDVWITVDSRDCGNIEFSLDALDAGWHHQVRAEILYKGEVKQDILIWNDSHTALGDKKSVNVKDDQQVCSATVTATALAEPVERGLFKVRERTFFSTIQHFLNSLFR